MACKLEMYNTNSIPPSQPMSPRISFSNDFAESHSNNSRSFERLPPPSLDFEFSVSNHNMLPADELFSKGRLLPFKDISTGCSSNGQMQRTLRDELLVDDEVDFSLKPPKGAWSSSSTTNRWKGFLGLRKSHIGSKKSEKSGSFDDDAKRFTFPIEDPNLAKSLQDTLSSDSQTSTDMEMGI
ncbi:hypothetical protein vseg_005195 [Gypsophila vaccaria]